MTVQIGGLQIRYQVFHRVDMASLHALDNALAKGNGHAAPLKRLGQ